MKKLIFYNIIHYFSLFLSILLILNFLVVSKAYAQQTYKIYDIHIIGNVTISEKEIKDFLSIEKEKEVTLDILINIEEKLMKWGYFDSVSVDIIEVEKSQNQEQEANFRYINIVIYLLENLPVNKIEINYPNFYLKNIKSKMKLKENKAFNPKYLEKDLEYISAYPFVSRVSSNIKENEKGISIEINITYKNVISDEISLSTLFFNELKYFFGKTYIPFYISLFTFYPFNSTNYMPTVAISSGFSLLPNFYLSFTFSSEFVDAQNNLLSNNIFLSLIFKNQFIKKKNLIFAFNPFNATIAYDLNKERFKNFTICFDSNINLFNIFLIFNRTNFSYFFYDYFGYYGNTPNNAMQTSLIFNKELNIFLYQPIFNSFDFRFIKNQTHIYSNFVFSNSIDMTIKIYSNPIFYIGFISSSDIIFTNNEEQKFLICYGVGIIFSISIKRFIEFPLTIQYFFLNNFSDGVFYITLLSKRFSF